MIVGIDPGKKTGLAFFDHNGLKELKTTNFWGAVSIIDEYDHLYILEMPRNKHVWKGRAIDVGSVIREAELLKERLQIKARRFKIFHPLGKINHYDFVKITGWKGKTNQHTRDAAMMVLSTVNKKIRNEKTSEAMAILGKKM